MLLDEHPDAPEAAMHEPARRWGKGFLIAGERGHRFDAPAGNLVSYLDRGLIKAGRALDLGCGPGRNALYLASVGFEVDAELSDADFYRQSRLHDGLAYTPESLRWIFSDLTEIELRRMHEEPPESPCFGEPLPLDCPVPPQASAVTASGHLPSDPTAAPPSGSRNTQARRLPFSSPAGRRRIHGGPR